MESLTSKLPNWRVGLSVTVVLLMGGLIINKMMEPKGKPENVNLGGKTITFHEVHGNKANPKATLTIQYCGG